MDGYFTWFTPVVVYNKVVYKTCIINSRLCFATIRIWYQHIWWMTGQSQKKPNISFIYWLYKDKVLDPKSGITRQHSFSLFLFSKWGRRDRYRAGARETKASKRGKGSMAREEGRPGAVKQTMSKQKGKRSSQVTGHSENREGGVRWRRRK